VKIRMLIWLQGDADWHRKQVPQSCG